MSGPPYAAIHRLAPPAGYSCVARCGEPLRGAVGWSGRVGSGALPAVSLNDTRDVIVASRDLVSSSMSWGEALRGIASDDDAASSGAQSELSVAAARNDAFGTCSGPEKGSGRHLVLPRAALTRVGRSGAAGAREQGGERRRGRAASPASGSDARRRPARLPPGATPRRASGCECRARGQLRSRARSPHRRGA